MGERPTHSHADEDGHFRRKDSVFRNFISEEPGAKFPPEKDRYVLYVNYGCPWAHRSILVRALKSLEPIVDLVITDFDLTENGWLFSGRNGSPSAEPLYGFTNLKQLYLKADPNYQGRYTVPTLWDKKQHTIVNNESSEIIRMFYTAFDSFLDPQYREVNRPGGGFYPKDLRGEIDAMNDWVYNTINNGVYKCGFATTQEAYDANVYPLFASLDRIEKHLGDPAHQPYLFGENITEADIRLYTTMIRFDVAYVPIFQCNIRDIRHGYPRISRWLRNLYWDDSDRTNGGVFKKTTFFEIYKYGYLKAKNRQMFGGSDVGWTVVLPRGPVPDIEPLNDEEESKLSGGTVTSPNGAESLAGLSIDDASATSPNGGDEFEPKKLQRRTTHGEENKKWYKAAKKAEKQAGAANMHLAL